MLLIGSRLLKLLVTTKCISTRNFVYLFLFNFLLLQQTNSTSSRKLQIIHHLFYCILKIALSQYRIKKKQGNGNCLSFFPIIQSRPNHCAPFLFDTDIDSAIYLHQGKHHLIMMLMLFIMVLICAAVIQYPRWSLAIYRIQIRKREPVVFVPSYFLWQRLPWGNCYQIDKCPSLFPSMQTKTGPIHKGRG